MNERAVSMAAVLTGVAALALGGCTTLKIQQQYAGGELPRPDLVVVYNFAYSPGQVKLDRGVSPRVEAAMRGTSRTFAEMQAGAAVTSLVADKLVQKIRAMGLAAQRSDGGAYGVGNTVAIEGQFLTIDEGNRTERVVVGFGLGRSNLETDVQVYYDTLEGQRLVEALDVSAKSGRKPGMAATIAAGAGLGGVAVAAVVSSVTAVGSEKFAANIDADASRTADKVAAELKTFFAKQGWIQP